MKDTELKEELEKIAGELDIKVRYEQYLEGSGGLCTVHGEKKIILKKSLSLDETIDKLIEILKKENTYSIYIPPLVREYLKK